KTIMESSFLPNNAAEALVAFVTTLFVGLLMLIPGASFRPLGFAVLVVGLLNWIVMIWLEVSTLRQAPPPHRLGMLYLFLFSQSAALSFLAAGIIFLIWGAAAFYWIVAAIFLSFLAAFQDMWLLAIEINR